MNIKRKNTHNCTWVQMKDREKKRKGWHCSSETHHHFGGTKKLNMMLIFYCLFFCYTIVTSSISAVLSVQYEILFQTASMCSASSCFPLRYASLLTEMSQFVFPHLYCPQVIWDSTLCLLVVEGLRFDLVPPPTSTNYQLSAAKTQPFLPQGYSKTGHTSITITLIRREKLKLSICTSDRKCWRQSTEV